MDDIVLYLCFFAATLVLTVYSVARNSIVFTAVSGSAWFACALMSFIGTENPGPLQYGTGLFFLGIGLLLFTKVLFESTAMLHERRESVDL